MPSLSQTNNLDRDWQIRLAAFDHIRKLRDDAHRVSWAQLTAGFEFEGETVHLVSQKGIFKPRQLDLALAIRTACPSPGRPAPYDDQVDPAQEVVVYKYREGDAGIHDNNVLRRTGEMHRPLVWFYGLSEGVYQAEFPVWVMGDDPAAQAFHLAIEDDITSPERVLDGGLPSVKKAYATTLAKRRLHQGRFRELVLSAYQRQCTVCTIGVKRARTNPTAGKRLIRLLDAAHILADRDEQGRPEVPNGLSLCKIHHSAYDLNILGISPDRIVHIREDILNEVDGPMLQHGIKEMSGRPLHLPRRKADHPNPEYLALRFEEFVAA